MSQQSQSQSSSTSAESRQEEAAAASVTKRENNWSRILSRLLCARLERYMIIIALPIGAIFVVQCRSIDELYEVNGLRHHGARRVRLSTSSLKQLGCTVRVNPTYRPTNPKCFSNNGLNQIVIFPASVNPAYKMNDWDKFHISCM